jgi:hypothetical protein
MSFISRPWVHTSRPGVSLHPEMVDATTQRPCPARYVPPWHFASFLVAAWRRPWVLVRRWCGPVAIGKTEEIVIIHRQPTIVHGLLSESPLQPPPSRHSLSDFIPLSLPIRPWSPGRLVASSALNEAILSPLLPTVSISTSHTRRQLLHLRLTRSLDVNRQQRPLIPRPKEVSQEPIQGPCFFYLVSRDCHSTPQRKSASPGSVSFSSVESSTVRTTWKEAPSRTHSGKKRQTTPEDLS